MYDRVEWPYRRSTTLAVPSPFDTWRDRSMERVIERTLRSRSIRLPGTAYLRPVEA